MQFFLYNSNNNDNLLGAVTWLESLQGRRKYVRCSYSGNNISQWSRNVRKDVSDPDDVTKVNIYAKL